MAGRITVESLLGGSDVHLHLFPGLIYQALFRLAGLTPYFPYLGCREHAFRVRLAT